MTVTTIILVVVACCIYGSYLKKMRNRVSYSFKEVMDLVEAPVITLFFTVKGRLRKYNFIVDTGATNCFMDKDAMDYMDDKILLDNPDREMYSASGKSDNLDTYEIPFEYHGYKYKYAFIRMTNFKDARNYIKNTTGVDVVGQIGSDFFKDTDAKIDFEEFKITFNKTNRNARDYKVKK